MGFTSNQEAVHNPAKYFLRWKGGAEKIRENGVEKIEGGKLIYWDTEKQEEVEVSLPIVFCPLEITYGYSGFLPDKGRLWSNEILDFKNQVITVNLTGDDTEKICEGTYEQIKDKAFANGAKLQTYVYAYCKQLGGIVRFNLGGSARSAWKDFVKKVKISSVYEHPISLEVDEPKESQLGPYIPPKYTLGKTYDNETIAKLSEQDKIVLDYLKYVANRKSYSDETNNIYPDDIPEEGSQEIPETIKATMGGGEEAEIDLTDVPF